MVMPDCMFCVSLFTGLVLYIYDGNYVQLFPNCDIVMDKNWYFVVFNLCSMMGDTLGRKTAYVVGKKTVFFGKYPFVLLVFSLFGTILCTFKYGSLCAIGISLIMFGNGILYGSTTKHIDKCIDKQYNLIALSMWLFVGDIGSVIGSNLIEPIKLIICKHPTLYTCVNGIVSVSPSISQIID